MAKQTNPLTDTACNAAKLKDKDYAIFNGQGLILYVRRSCKKVWRLKYKRMNGKDGLMTLGAYFCINIPSILVPTIPVILIRNEPQDE